MDLKEALRTALDFEEKGRNIYKEAASKTKNPIVEKTFRYLAEQEQNHTNKIKEFTRQERADVELKGDSLEDTKNFFTTTVQEFKEKIELSEDDAKAHETALELEQSSYDFYKEQIEKADGAAKNLFRFLMEQENTHYMLIQKAYNYIKDPANFYVEEEQWVFEG